jgi:hypothetical protein
MGAFGQLESVWPVHGSVLIRPCRQANGVGQGQGLQLRPQIRILSLPDMGISRCRARVADMVSSSRRAESTDGDNEQEMRYDV